jgi:hypothetical protein
MIIRSLSVLSLITVLGACGGSGTGSSTGGGTGLGSDIQSVTGTVFAPNGTDPIAGATVYVPSSTANLSAPTTALKGVGKAVTATCGGSTVTCSDPTATALCSTCTCPDGTFSLDVSSCSASDSTTLKIESGSTTIDVTFSSDCTTTDTTCAITTAASTLPSSGTGALTMAVVTGEYDEIQDVLAKLGYGDLDTDNRLKIGTEKFTIYRGGDTDLDVELAATSETTYPLASSLFGDVTLMNTFDIIFINCGADETVTTTASTINTPLTATTTKHHTHAEYHAARKAAVFKGAGTAIDATVIANIKSYVEAGGKLYVTDWAYDFIEQAFPGVMDFQGSGDGDATTVETNSAAQVGDSTDANSSSLVSNALVKDTTMSTWLSSRKINTLDSATTPSLSSCTTTSSADESNTTTSALNSDDTIRIGDFLSAWAVMKEAYDSDTTVWIEGSVNFSSGTTATRPLTISRTQSSGKVLYSSYHSAHSCPTTGFWPQERVLQYLVFEIAK